MIEFIKKYRWHVISVIAIMILLFMHLYNLTEVPYGLNVDEAGGAYDALNIARYGVDRHLKSYPVYFTNYRDGQNALYIYATAVLIKLFGMSKLIIRTTIALGAIVAAYFGWRYMKVQWPERQGKCIWLLLYAGLPVFTMTQRFGLESHLMLPMAMVSLYMTARMLDTGKWRYCFAAGVTLGITLYSYALSYIVVPVFLLLLFVYVLLLKKVEWKKWLCMAAVLAVFAAPLILVQAINYFDLPEMRLGPITFTKLLDYRIEEVAGVSIFENIKSMFVNTFLYDDLTYNTLEKYGTMFYVSIPFVVLGFGVCIYEGVQSIKEKAFYYAVPMVMWFVAQWIMGAMLSGNSVPNSTRMIGVFVPMLYFLVRGLYWVWDLFKKVVLKKTFATIMSICYGVLFLNFAGYYFTDYNEDAFPMKWLFYETYEEVGDFLEENKDQSWYERTMVYPWNYVYYLLEYEVNPYEFSMTINGIQTFGKDYINELPAKLQFASNYVIYKTDTGSQDYLRQLGYKELKAGENFSIFVSQLDSYEYVSNDDVFVNIDDYIVEGDYLVMNGWCADGISKNPMKDLILETEDATYTAELIERADVATHLGKEGDNCYGFAIQMPVDIFKYAEYLKLSGISAQGEQEEIFIFERK